MSEKKELSKAAGIAIVGHLNIYAQKVSEVVSDYHSVESNNDMPAEGKIAFAAACMKDVAILSDYLVNVLEKALADGGVVFPSDTDKVMEELAPEAAVVDLNEYKARGGLLN